MNQRALALDHWLRCLRAHFGGQQAGDVATWRSDPLSRAACAEATVLEFVTIPSLQVDPQSLVRGSMCTNR